jgi:hypothetical protein
VNRTDRVLHNVTVDVGFTTTGSTGAYGGFDGPPQCDPASPKVCTLTASEPIFPSAPMPLNGSFIDTGSFYPDPADASGGFFGLALAGTWTYTGTIEGCTGSGTFVSPYTAKRDADPIAPNPDGAVVRGHDPLFGVTSQEGFAGIVDVRIDGSYRISPVGFTASDGHLLGYILCY